MTPVDAPPPRDGGAPCGDDAVKETLAFIRAHGTIRFVALPFFLAAVATLAKVYHGHEDGLPDALVAWTALGVCVVAGIVEIVLSRNLIAWWAALDAHLAHAPHWRLVRAHRDPAALRAVRWTLFAPYLAGFGYWLHELASRAMPAATRTEHAAALVVAVAVVMLAIVVLTGAVWRRAAQPAVEPEPRPGGQPGAR